MAVFSWTRLAGTVSILGIIWDGNETTNFWGIRKFLLSPPAAFVVRKLVPADSSLRVVDAKPAAGERDLFRLRYRSVSPLPLSTPLRCPLPARQAPATASYQVRRAWHSSVGRTAPGCWPGKSRLQTFQEKKLYKVNPKEKVSQNLWSCPLPSPKDWEFLLHTVKTGWTQKIIHSQSAWAAHCVPDTMQGLSFLVLISSRPHHNPKVGTIYCLHFTSQKTRIWKVTSPKTSSVPQTRIKQVLQARAHVFGIHGKSIRGFLTHVN